MTGTVFRYFFFVMSFLVLWLQPNDSMNFKSFFIAFFIFIGSWWIDKIASMIEGKKSFGEMMKKENNESQEGIKEKWNRYCDECGNGISAFCIAVNGVIMLICVVIGAFLFVISIMGIMNFVNIEIDSDKNRMYMLVETGSNTVESFQGEQIEPDSYVIQKYLFKELKIDISLLFALSGACVVLELMYLLIQAGFDEFYSKLRGSNKINGK